MVCVLARYCEYTATCVPLRTEGVVANTDSLWYISRILQPLLFSSQPQQVISPIIWKKVKLRDFFVLVLEKVPTVTVSYW